MLSLSIQILVGSGKVDVNAVTLGTKTTPLHMAAALGNGQIVSLLLASPGKKRRQDKMYVHAKNLKPLKVPSGQIGSA